MIAQAQQAPLQETQQLRTFLKKRNNRDNLVSRGAEVLKTSEVLRLHNYHHRITSRQAPSYF